MEVETPNVKEAEFLYSEIFATGAYLKHGIEVRDGDTVVDAGANVGMFSASLARAHRDLRLVCFEPVPDTFALLERNARRLLGGARVTLVRAGLSSAPGRATFEVDRAWTVDAGASGALREVEASSLRARRRAGLLAWDRAAVEDAMQAGVLPPRAARRLRAALDDRRTRPLAIALLWSAFAVVGLRRRRRRRRVECELTTLSAALREHGIDAVDLVKVDVEGAEEAVLAGIEDADWPRLRQLVLEVHDVDGRPERLRRLLEARGFDVTVEQDDWELLRLQGIRMIYARR